MSPFAAGLLLGLVLGGSLGLLLLTVLLLASRSDQRSNDL